jgi:hypothetical protein
MWFLQHESLFDGKRVWLRPGSQQLFGRTKGGKHEEGKNVFIDHKTVSRQHMMLKVLEVPDGDGTKLHTRSTVEIVDLSCRQGTIIDGEKTLVSKKEGGSIAYYDKTVLMGTQHTVKLSASYPPFTITWQPIVFTFASKEAKGQSAQLHALDIKTTKDFVYNQTTHVISLKRNLPKVLQGLVSARHIVTPDFLDAVISIATPQNTDPENYKASRLEEGFDDWWPKEKEFIPPFGAEPVARPEQMLEPDERRSEIFSGLIFIFLNEGQYNSLQEPIAGGGGKALLFHVQLGETTVDEYVQYVRSAAGQKSRAKGNDTRLPVVTIRLSNFPDGMEEWATNFVTGVDQTLNQRSIQQNEFLDAILTNDASSLQKPAPELEIASSMPPKIENSIPTQDTRSRGASEKLEVPEPTPAPKEEPVKTNPRKRPARRGIMQSRFTGFDDYEPAPKARKIEQDTAMDDIETVPAQIPNRASQPQYRSATQGTQRHRQSPIEATIEETNMDDLFPAAAEVKRRRAATRDVSVPAESEAVAAPRPKTKGEMVLEKLQKAKKKVSKEINVQEKLRLQQEEERRREDEENLREQLEGVDISEIRSRVQVEEMAIAPRQNRPIQRTDVTTERWKDEWNGRKNFKKFRRRGTEQGLQSQKVIVSFEEAPQKKGFGLGDAFYLEELESPNKSRKKGRAEDSSSEPEPGFTRNRRDGDREVINIEDSDLGEDDVVVPATASTQRSRTQRVAETPVTNTQSQTQRGTKRPPVTVATGQPLGKRSRPTRRADDSDDEETGFRFRRRG